MTDEDKQRIEAAVRLLRDMIDGGEECRGRDSEISHIIGILENDWYHINSEPLLSIRVHGLQPQEA